jgi:hypothetical protein
MFSFFALKKIKKDVFTEGVAMSGKLGQRR